MSVYGFPRSLPLGILLNLISLLVFSWAAGAQTTAEIVGTVTDASGAIVPGAAVTATNVSTGAVHTALTEQNGAFFLRLLPPGKYSVRAELQGFKTWVLAEVALAVGDRLRLEPRMEIGQLEESVEVNSAATPALQTEASSVGNLISVTAVESLPVNGRNFINLVALTAGAGDAVQASVLGTLDDRRQSSSISINGNLASANNFLLDGMDDNERFNGLVVVKPSMDAIHEMKVETNKYSAEFGRTQGGVINIITKSGTNEFHGSVFEFLRNEALDARNYFATKGIVPKPAYKQNQFGFSFGGPIVKNRTFFFTDYQGLRVRYGQTSTVAVPTADNRAGKFTQAIYDPLTTRVNPANPSTFIRDAFPAVNGITDISSFINPVAKRVLALWPLPNGGTAASPRFTQTATRPQRDDRGDVRIDHRIGVSDSIFGRYSVNDAYTYVPSQMPVVNGINPGTGTQAGPAYQRAQAVGLNWVHAFGSRLVMELKGGFNRFANAALHTNYGNNASEQLGINGVNWDPRSSGLAIFAGLSPAQLGDAAFLPTFCINNIYHTQGTMSYIRSSHNIKVGGEYRVRQVLMHQTALAKPQFNFDATATNNPASGSGGNSFATFLLGIPTQTQRNMYLVDPFYSVNEVSWFVQDDWRAAGWLTLNLGVRYDYYGPTTERYDRIANVDLAAGKIVIAGQDGVSRTTGVVKDTNNFEPRVGFAATILPKTVLRGGFGLSFVPGSWNTPLAFRNPPFVSLLAEAYNTVTYLTNPVPTRTLSTPFPAFIPTSSDPNLVTGNLAPVDFNWRIPYTQQMNLALQREVGAGFVVTAGYVGQMTRKLKGGVNVNQLNPGETVRPYAAKFPKVGNGSITPNYTGWNSNYHSMQVVVERRFANGLALQSNYVWSHTLTVGAAQARAQLEKSRAGQGLNHRFVFSSTYELPFFKTSSGLLGAVGGGWQLNGIWRMATGTWLTVTNQSTRTGFVATSSTGGSGGVADRPNMISDPNDNAPHTIQKWFNTEAFVGQTIGTYGNAGGGIVQAPGMVNIDFSLAKTFRISEGVAMAFRFETFNTFNHPNFGSPNVALGNTLFGQITSALDPRNIQIGLRLTF